MRPHSHPLFPLGLSLFLHGAASADAQIVYDAGTSGNPAQAPAPVSQGWTESITGTCNVAHVSPDPDFPVNAWQINDSGSGRVRYRQEMFTNLSNYEVEVVMRPLAGTIYLEIDAGELITDNLFKLQLELVGSDIHVSTLGGGQALVCPDAADGYHSYRFLSGHNWDVAELRYDGLLLGTIPYTSFGLGATGNGLRIGTLPTSAGRARFHHFSMDVVRPREIGENYCAPAIPHSGGIPARMEAYGVPYWFYNDVTLHAADLPPHRFGYFLVSATQDMVTQPGGSLGNLCLGGSIGRYSSSVLDSGATGTFALGIDLSQLPTEPASAATAGEQWNFQAWFRDFHQGGTSNFTDACAIRF